MAEKNPTVDVSKIVGYKYPDRHVTYNKRDLLLYAVSIGATDLRFTYELDPLFEAFPTYALVLALKGDSGDVNSYAERSKGTFSIPGFPKINLNRLVHGDQSYELLAPLPIQGGTFTLQSKMIGVYDAGKGMVTESESYLVDASGKKYVHMTSSAFIIGAGNFGGPKRPKPTIQINPPNRTPDASQVDTLSPHQALLYRLSGDYNPLHADPSLGKKLGMKGAFLHGLCTYGFSASAVLKHFAGNEGKRFVSIKGRFASPVYPGETLETRMWRVGTVKEVGLGNAADQDVIAFETFVGDRAVIAGGVAVVRTGAAKL
ncbi:peroxisomal dehydratase [Zopfochytrium polystomum]|nr:peroxisomal dehydratase [Zopfochytrium polystomum]